MGSKSFQSAFGFLAINRHLFMTDIKQLSKLAESFHAKAITAQKTQKAQFLDTMIKQMAALAAGSVVSVKHLQSIPKYRSSVNLNSVLAIFQQIHDILSNINTNDPFNQLEQLKQLLGTVSFYSSPGNAGTGRDPIMDIQKDGYTPPSYYVNQLTRMLDAINKHIYN
jgi:hypothetical protein